MYKLLKLNSLDGIEDAINLAFKKTCKQHDITVLKLAHLKTLFNILRTTLRLFYEFSKMNENVSTDSTLDVNEFKKFIATD